MVSVVDLIVSAVGQGRFVHLADCFTDDSTLSTLGWAFTILGALCLAVTPLIFIEVSMGAKWRARRM
jgi:hypothetical protein